MANGRPNPAKPQGDSLPYPPRPEERIAKALANIPAAFADLTRADGELRSDVLLNWLRHRDPEFVQADGLWAVTRAVEAGLLERADRPFREPGGKGLAQSIKTVHHQCADQPAGEIYEISPDGNFYPVRPGQLATYSARAARARQYRDHAGHV